VARLRIPGLSDVFNLVVRPNLCSLPGDVYQAKTRRWSRRWPSLTVLPWPAVGGERGGGAGQQEGGGEYDGGNPEAAQDADAVAKETNRWRPGEEGHVAD
jgi:hypothetical protein